MNVDFYKEFIDIKCDNILLENNNPLVSSNDEYLVYKKSYFDKTKNNYQSYITKYKNLSSLVNSEYIVTDKRYTYKYIDKTSIEKLNTEIKDIILEQRYLLNNFIYYVESLNNKFKENSQQTRETSILNFFSKFTSKNNKQENVKGNTNDIIVKSNSFTDNIKPKKIVRTKSSGSLKESQSTLKIKKTKK